MKKSYFAKNISELANRYSNENTNINYLISYSINSNRTISLDLERFTRKLSSKILNEMNIPRRSDLTYLELKYPTVGSDQDAFNKFFDSATVFARLYKEFIGCQVIDVSNWVSETQSNRFNDLLNYFRNSSEDSRFIVLAQVTDAASVKRLVAVLSTSMEIYPIFLENWIEEQVMEHIIQEFKCHQLVMNVESQVLVKEWIENERLNAFLHQTNGVKLLVKAIFNSLHVEDNNELDSNQDVVVTKQQLTQFEQNFLSYINVEISSKRKIGF